MTTLIIAEAGVNHNGDIKMAKELIAVAADAGADIIKFQTFIADNLTSILTPKAEYQMFGSDDRETHKEMLSKLELKRNHHLELIEECRNFGIGFLSTAFDEDSLCLLEELGYANIVKVASGEITNLPFLRRLSQNRDHLFLSTGMSNLGEIESAINVIEEFGTSRDKITVLHCNTDYPTSFNDVNLMAMVNIGKSFGVRFGYSDHTMGIEVPIAAVALGATVIEKHFTLDRKLKGPDHRASLEPDELKFMIKSIRNIEKSLGDGIKRPTLSELKNKPIVRKSIVASRYIKAGEVFSEENLAVKRPGSGISPMLWDNVIGRVSSRDFNEDELIEL